MKSRISVFFLAIAALLFTACQDDVTTIGSSLVFDSTEILIDSAFTVKGQSVTDPVVQSRTITQLLGRLQAKEYGDITSDVVMQFLPSMNIDTAGVTVEDIDSVKLYMFMAQGDFTGDSLVPMGLQVYNLTKQLPSPIYSDFDPEGYYDPTPIASQIYTANALYNDSVNNLIYRSVVVDLPLQFGKDLFTHYLEHPGDFSDPQAFTKWFPGFYVTNSFGSGLVINIMETRVNLYFKQHSTYYDSEGELQDSIYNQVRSYLTVAPEVITNNNISFTISDYLQNKIDQGEALLVSPTGTEIEIEFPLQELISTYKNNTGALSIVNSLEFTIPAEVIENDYGINPPTDVLLILAKDKIDFFAQNKITDEITSFMGYYSSYYGRYDFGDLKNYLTEMLEKDEIEPEDYKFIITPVNIETETTDSYYGSGATYVTNISPYVTKPAMVKLNLDEAKIKLTYTRQSTKNY